MRLLLLPLLLQVYAAPPFHTTTHAPSRTTFADRTWTTAEIQRLTAALLANDRVRRLDYTTMELVRGVDGPTIEFRRGEETVATMGFREFATLTAEHNLPGLGTLTGSLTLHVRGLPVSTRPKSFSREAATIVAQAIARANPAFAAHDLANRPELVRSIRVVRDENRGVVVVDHLFFEREVRLEEQGILHAIQRAAGIGGETGWLADRYPTILFQDRLLRTEDVLHRAGAVFDVRRELNRARAARESSFRVAVDTSTGLPAEASVSPGRLLWINVNLLGMSATPSDVARLEERQREIFNLFLRSLR